MKVAGGGPSVHACAVFLVGAKSRHGDKFNQTPLESLHLVFGRGPFSDGCRGGRPWLLRRSHALCARSAELRSVRAPATTRATPEANNLAVSNRLRIGATSAALAVMDDSGLPRAETRVRSGFWTGGMDSAAGSGHHCEAAPKGTYAALISRPRAVCRARTAPTTAAKRVRKLNEGSLRKLGEGGPCDKRPPNKPDLRVQSACARR